MNDFATLTHHEALVLLADRFGAREALVTGGRRYSFRDVRDSAEAASARLATLGLAAGDTLAIWMPNRVELLWYLLGAARMGLVPVVLNTRLKREEIRYQIGQSRSRAVILPGTGGFRDFLADLTAICPGITDGTPGSIVSSDLPDLKYVVACDAPPPGFSGVTDWSSPPPAALPVPPPATDPARPSLIFYSSGTTSLPKGVMLGHALWRKGYDAGACLGLTANDRLYVCVPLFGMAGLLAGGPFSAWPHGAAVVLDERFDAGACLAALERERCTVFQMMPTMIQPLVDHPHFARIDRAGWRVGMVLSSDTAVLRSVVDRVGFRHVVCGYGLTESTALVTRTRWTQSLDEQVATNGRPLPDCTVRIVDPETGTAAPAGTRGEILIGGYCVMVGYYGKPEETAKAIDSDGWLHTGDAGVLEADGSLRFLGRLRDSYKHKGFNVSTREVEAVASGHPAVAAVAVVGVPDPILGEVGVAFVIAKAGASVDTPSLTAFLSPRLASFKLPSHVFAVDAFPLTAGTDKVQGFRLREMAMERLGLKPAAGADASPAQSQVRNAPGVAGRVRSSPGGT